MVKEVASKTNEEAGDGTTTATVLAQAIAREGCKYVAAGMNPMDLKRGIDLAVEAVITRIKESSRKLKSIKDAVVTLPLALGMKRFSVIPFPT